MSIKEKWQDYRQRQEAKAYFRSHNHYILKGKDYALMIGVGLIEGLIIGAILAFIENLLPVSFAIIYILIGYLMAETMKRLTDIRSKQVGIVSAVMTLVCVYLREVIGIIMMQSSLLMNISFLTVLRLAFGALASIGLVGWLFILAGMYVAYIRSL